MADSTTCVQREVQRWDGHILFGESRQTDSQSSAEAQTSHDNNARQSSCHARIYTTHTHVGRQAGRQRETSIHSTENGKMSA
mmetsp:Transcript_12505/g.29863  ORF Transcript_12505/g.29863 Transcript_12505/m.29863 type:complete len:82 (+) Transcript_12505:830-1075(+)